MSLSASRPKARQEEWPWRGETAAARRNGLGEEKENAHYCALRYAQHDENEHQTTPAREKISFAVTSVATISMVIAEQHGGRLHSGRLPDAAEEA